MAQHPLDDLDAGAPIGSPVTPRCGATGQSPSWITAMLAQMGTDSSGNPTAVQTTDINAQRGDPSVGLMQVIHIPGHVDPARLGEPDPGRADRSLG